jgi:hypothetical protein
MALCSCSRFAAPEHNNLLNGETVTNSMSNSKSDYSPSNNANKRSLNDLKFSADLTQEQVEAGWGDPDGHRGSGIDYFEYALEDGSEVWLAYLNGVPPRKLMGALRFNPSSKQFEHLYN